MTGVTGHPPLGDARISSGSPRARRNATIHAALRETQCYPESASYGQASGKSFMTLVEAYRTGQLTPEEFAELDPVTRMAMKLETGMP
jgi:hypothetical protein